MSLSRRVVPLGAASVGLAVLATLAGCDDTCSYVVPVRTVDGNLVFWESADHAIERAKATDGGLKRPIFRDVYEPRSGDLELDIVEAFKDAVVTVRAPGGAPTLRFRRPSTPGRYALSEVDAVLVESGTESRQRPAMKGELVVREVVPTCAGAYGEGCMRLDADLRIDAEDADTSGPTGLGSAHLVYRNDAVRQTCSTAPNHFWF